VVRRMKHLPWDYAVRNLARSPVRLALSVTGGALVVLLVIAAGAFVRGISRTLAVTGGEGNVILLGAGSEESVERSEISPTVPGLVSATVGGIKSQLGTPMVSPEVYFVTPVKLGPKDATGAQVSLRGITPAAFLVHREARLVEGRLPAQGREELIVGALAAAKLGVPGDRLAIGKMIWFDNRPWTIVGRFEAPGTVMEAEVWCVLSDIQIAAKRDNLSCVVVALDPREAEFEDVDVFARRRLDLELVAMRERDYYAKLLAFYRPIQLMAWATAILIATGGLFGGLNTMYAAFASRVRELGALQSIGYSRYAIVVSLVQESVLATATGALIAAGLALWLIDGLHVRFSIGVFALTIDTGVLALGLGAGLLLGIVGALPPAWRCLRLPISEALKAV
jgi:putative ABC transport system permease protein